MNTNLEEAYSNMQYLSRAERINLSRELLHRKPPFLTKITPGWWWYRPCEVHVLLVADGGLDFGIGTFGLSEFVTTFEKLERQSPFNVRYRVTLAHRRDVSDFQMLNTNTFVTARIKKFNFETSVTLNNFDQVWLFGIENADDSTSLKTAEVNKIEAYMDGGGGIFATGDHGYLGSALCSQIPRVKDMRLWKDTSTDTMVNEVSMSGKRRNDTNRPGAGESVSNRFNNQSDNIPQHIAVRTFGNGLPHPLLSIPTSLRSSGIIDIMPDHPHEGECTPERVFTVKNPSTGLSQNVSTQIIATSFVLGGSTIEFMGKQATDPHCFPSISVFDGSVANVGRIVVDSTWHHFVNINLNGSGSGLTGLSDDDFNVVQRYYMNIATWMTRKKNRLCGFRTIWIPLLKESQLIEASLNNPKLKLKDIGLSELYSIGALAKEILSTTFSPAFAHEFMVAMVEPAMPALAERLNIWKPLSKENKENKELKGAYYQDWINYDIILGTAVGSGFVALRDNEELFTGTLSEETFEKLTAIFFEGTKFGIEASTSNLVANFTEFSKLIGQKNSKKPGSSNDRSDTQGQ